MNESSDKPTIKSKRNAYLWGHLYKNIEEKVRSDKVFIIDDDKVWHTYTSELLDAIFKDMFLCHTKITVNGKTRKLCFSTSELTNKFFDDERGTRISFDDYVKKIKEFCLKQWKIEIEDGPTDHGGHAQQSTPNDNQWEES